MTTPNSTQDVEAIARELMEARIQAACDLAEAGNARTAAEEAFTSADTEYGRRYTAAVKNGWTEGELARMQLAKPGARVRKRPASRRGADGSTPDANGAPQDGGAAVYS